MQYKIKLLTLTIITITLFPSVLYSNSDIYYDKKQEGWFWHKTEPKKEETKNTKAPEPAKKQEAVERVEQIKQRTKELLSTAIVDPTQENVVEYMRHQKRLFEMADRFKDTWEVALLTHPELDYTADHPISAIALQTASREEHIRQKERIRKIGQEAGIYFIFSSTCPYCIEQAKILKRFENSYEISVFPLTTNREGLPEYPDPAIGTWMVQKFGITKTPALILAYPQEGKMLPLASGLITGNELIRRILILNQRKGTI